MSEILAGIYIVGVFVFICMAARIENSRDYPIEAALFAAFLWPLFPIPLMLWWLQKKGWLT